MFVIENRRRRINKRKAKRRRNKKIIYSILTILWFVGIGKVGWYIGYNELNLAKYFPLKGNEEINDKELALVVDVNEESKSDENEESKSEEEVQPSDIVPPENENIVYSNESEQVDNNTEIHNDVWVDNTEEIYHEEIGHWEEVLRTPESVVIVPVYERKELSICNGCGADITINPISHIESRRKSGYLKCNGYHTEWREVQIDSREEVIPAVYNKVWVVDKEAWTETR